MTTRPRRDIPVHYLRPNHTSWTPPSVFSFDTETQSEYIADDEVMTMRLWCARFTDRRAPRNVMPVDDTAHGDTGEDLAHIIHKWAGHRRTTWGYAHNLSFDLCTSSLIQELTLLGWDVTEFAVSSGSPFVRMRRGDHGLVLSDSWSWFNAPLMTVADAIGMRKPPLPGDDDTEEMWRQRCLADTNILQQAMLALMDWWDDNALGRWNITGSSSGWNAMRHIPSHDRILIRPDDSECTHDRGAIYGGRRYCWRAGDSTYGHYSEVDIEKAYTTAVRDLPIPSGRQAQFHSLPLDHRWLDCARWGVIADCTIRTDTPLWPTRLGTAVFYPVGEFRATLAGPDIKEARDLGALAKVGPGWLHRLGYALRPWATWCISSMQDNDTSTPDVAKLVHRMWARSAIGKWNQRGWEVLQLGPSPNAGWNYEEAWHHEKNVPAGIVDFAGIRYQVAAVSQSDNAYPAVLAFVESYVRVALGRAIRVCGGTDMVSCDTDGFICNHVTDQRMHDINTAISPFRVREKRHYRRVKVTGPQHLELDQVTRRAGIPASAVPMLDGRLWARTWPKLAWQLQHGRSGAYTRPSQTYQLASTYAPGWVLTNGTVAPVEVRIGPDGCNQVVPWPETRYAAQGLILGEHQNRHLGKYRDG